MRPGASEAGSAPLIFVCAVVLHCGVLVLLGQATPGSFSSDTNVYLELASNLWSEGTYGTKVSVTYPPLYPMVIAPAFAIGANALRFAAIYVVHGILLGLASLLCLPMMTAALGPRRGWLALALVQLAGGASLHGYVTQSEALFGPLLVAATGLAWTAWHSDRRGAWLGLGVVAGLAVCTRRMGLVVPLALALLCLQDLWAARRGGLAPVLARWGLVAVGLGVGFAPEAAARAMHGASFSPYSAGAAGSHLDAGARALGSARHAWLLVQVPARHLGYLAVVTFGAPLLIGAGLLLRGAPGSLALRRSMQLVTWMTAGSVALTSLHIIRFWLRPSVAHGWELYPRYVDPLEVPLMLLALPAALLLAERGLGKAGGSLRAGLGPVFPLWGLSLLCVAIAGGLDTTRGGRILRTEVLAKRLASIDGGLASLAPWVFPAFSVVVLVGFAFWIRRGHAPRLAHLALAIGISWAVSWHSPLDRLTSPARATPKVLRATSLQEAPGGPLAIHVAVPGPDSRHYYEPAFRSDHRVSFVSSTELDAWTAAHPDGLVLGFKGDPQPPLQLRQRSATWMIYRAVAVEEGDADPEDEEAEPLTPEPEDD